MLLSSSNFTVQGHILCTGGDAQTEESKKVSSPVVVAAGGSCRLRFFQVFLPSPLSDMFLVSGSCRRSVLSGVPSLSLSGMFLRWGFKYLICSCPLAICPCWWFFLFCLDFLGPSILYLSLSHFFGFALFYWRLASFHCLLTFDCALVVPQQICRGDKSIRATNHCSFIEEPSVVQHISAHFFVDYPVHASDRIFLADRAQRERERERERPISHWCWVEVPNLLGCTSTHLCITSLTCKW